MSRSRSEAVLVEHRHSIATVPLVEGRDYATLDMPTKLVSRGAAPGLS